MIEADFRSALRHPDQPTPIGLKGAHDTPAGKRFSVYRNNVAVGLIDAIEYGFPTIAQLLGPTNIRSVARIYAQSHLPTNPLMIYYGSSFADFLAEFEPLAHLPYLADVARLEYAMRLSYHAVDADPIDPACLSHISEGSKIILAPAVQVVTSKHPIYDIWAFHALGAQSQPTGTTCAFIARPEFDPQPHPIPRATALFVQSLQRGIPLGAAMDGLDDLDLGSTLGLLLAHGAITDIRSI